MKHPSAIPPALVVLTLMSAGCSSGDDDQGVVQQGPSGEFVEDTLLGSDEALTLANIDLESFNAIVPALQFELSESAFDTSAGSTALWINGQSQAADAVFSDSRHLDLSASFNSGLNRVKLKAYDAVGRPLFWEDDIWFGSHTLSVVAVDQDGTPLAGPVDVRVLLGDDERVTSLVSSATSTVEVPNLPDRTLLLEATTPDGLLGVTGGLGGQGTVTMAVVPFGDVSDVDNNDFALGLEGWEVDDANAFIVSHEEGLPGAGPPSGSMDQDLEVRTAGEGPQTVYRTFTPSLGSTYTAVRFRFITSEVPGGYFGTQYNDYYAIRVRTSSSGEFINETQTMNGLGLGAFDFATGATAWRSVGLQLEPLDEIQVEAAVANVGDGALDSSIVLDFVEERIDKVTQSIAWDPVEGGLQVNYEVLEQLGMDGVDLNVAWASSANVGSVIGSPLLTHTIPAGTPAGSGMALRIDGAALADDPENGAFLVAYTSPTSLGSTPDVRVRFGAQADASVVAAAMIDIVEDALREAGLATGTISSTARSPEDQARVMFNVLTSPAQTIAQNIQSQLDLYGSNGDQVVQVFAAEVDGLSRAEVLADGDRIKSLMLAKIFELGPSNVSRHCADPAVTSVVDLGKSQFPGATSSRFFNVVDARCDRVLDEPAPNNAFHLELDL